MGKKTAIIWGLCSIGVTGILVCLTLFVMLIMLCIDDNLISGSILIGWAGLILLGAELIRKQLMDEYHISFRKWFLLTVIPLILVLVIYNCIYLLWGIDIFGEDLLLGLLIEMFMHVWGNCVFILVAGTLLIALIRNVVKFLRRKMKRIKNIIKEEPLNEFFERPCISC